MAQMTENFDAESNAEVGTTAIEERSKIGAKEVIILSGAAAIAGAGVYTLGKGAVKLGKKVVNFIGKKTGKKDEVVAEQPATETPAEATETSAPQEATPEQ